MTIIRIDFKECLIYMSAQLKLNILHLEKDERRNCDYRRARHKMKNKERNLPINDNTRERISVADQDEQP